MPPLSAASDLSVRAAVVQGVCAAFADIRLDLLAISGRAGDIVADTRWTSPAMDAYESQSQTWRDDVAALAGAILMVEDGLRRLRDEMVLTELLRAAHPGMAVAR